MEIKNWILKKHINNIQVISENYMPFYLTFLVDKGVIVNKNLSKVDTFVNWNLYRKKYSFHYNYEGCEDEVTGFLKNSDLIKNKMVIMDFGYDNPIISISTDYFINNWYDFIIGAHYESTVISENGQNIMEFTKRSELISNFLIN